MLRNLLGAGPEAAPPGVHIRDGAPVPHSPVVAAPSPSAGPGTVAPMTTSSTPQTLTVRSVDDLLALTTVVLGFQPSESVVMLTIGSPQTFHARVDLPADLADLDELVECLAGPAIRHGAPAVVFLLYTPDDTVAATTLGALRRRFGRAGIRLVEALRVEPDRWYPMLRARLDGGAEGVQYDVSAHPFVADAVLSGRVLHGSRAELAAILRPVPGKVEAVAAARGGERRAAGWVVDRVARHVAAATVPGDRAAAALLEAISEPDVRDLAWLPIRRGNARDHVRLWSDLVTRAPDDLVPHAAAVLAFAAWVSGDGALAWCAVDRAQEIDPRHSLARLVADMLTAAVSPAEWEEAAAGWRSAS